MRAAGAVLGDDTTRIASRAGSEDPGPADPVFPDLGLAIGETRTDVDICCLCDGAGRRWLYADRPDRCDACDGSGEVVHDVTRVNETDYEYVPRTAQREMGL